MPKTALVTGGGSGIGLAIARKISTDHDVTIIDTKTPMFLPRGATWREGDIRDFSPLDLPMFDTVVLNAAIFGEDKGLGEIMSVNFFGNIAMIDRVGDGGNAPLIRSAAL